MQRAQLEKHSKNGCLVFRNLGTCCSVHVFAEASVRLRKDCGLRSQPDEPDNSSISKSSNDLAMTLSLADRGLEGFGVVPSDSCLLQRWDSSPDSDFSSLRAPQNLLTNIAHNCLMN
ncbi:uncharacterized protein [Phaenicophaeus curvirostris]|uniref:uncharacterized protein isoform X2 n=1 Tax=Phaenicophaeus curvirostris TaxID=33595 RepID=UPI0037F09A5D